MTMSHSVVESAVEKAVHVSRRSSHEEIKQEVSDEPIKISEQVSTETEDSLIDDVGIIKKEVIRHVLSSVERIILPEKIDEYSRSPIESPEITHQVQAGDVAHDATEILMRKSLSGDIEFQVESEKLTVKVETEKEMITEKVEVADEASHTIVESEVEETVHVSRKSSLKEVRKEVSDESIKVSEQISTELEESSIVDVGIINEKVIRHELTSMVAIIQPENIDELSKSTNKAAEIAQQEPVGDAAHKATDDLEKKSLPDDVERVKFQDKGSKSFTDKTDKVATEKEKITEKVDVTEKVSPTFVEAVVKEAVHVSGKLSHEEIKLEKVSDEPIKVEEQAFTKPEESSIEDAGIIEEELLKHEKSTIEAILPPANIDELGKKPIKSPEIDQPESTGDVAHEATEVQVKKFLPVDKIQDYDSKKLIVKTDKVDTIIEMVAEKIDIADKVSHTLESALEDVQVLRKLSKGEIRQEEVSDETIKVSEQPSKEPEESLIDDAGIVEDNIIMHKITCVDATRPPDNIVELSKQPTKSPDTTHKEPPSDVAHEVYKDLGKKSPVGKDSNQLTVKVETKLGKEAEKVETGDIVLVKPEVEGVQVLIKSSLNDIKQEVSDETTKVEKQVSIELKEFTNDDCEIDKDESIRHEISSKGADKILPVESREDHARSPIEKSKSTESELADAEKLSEKVINKDKQSLTLEEEELKDSALAIKKSLQEDIEPVKDLDKMVKVTEQVLKEAGELSNEYDVLAESKLLKCKESPKENLKAAEILNEKRGAPYDASDSPHKGSPDDKKHHNGAIVECKLKGQKELPAKVMITEEITGAPESSVKKPQCDLTHFKVEQEEQKSVDNQENSKITSQKALDFSESNAEINLVKNLKEYVGKETIHANEVEVFKPVVPLSLEEEMVANAKTLHSENIKTESEPCCKVDNRISPVMFSKEGQIKKDGADASVVQAAESCAEKVIKCLDSSEDSTFENLKSGITTSEYKEVTELSESCTSDSFIFASAAAVSIDSEHKETSSGILPSTSDKILNNDNELNLECTEKVPTASVVKEELESEVKAIVEEDFEPNIIEQVSEDVNHAAPVPQSTVSVGSNEIETEAEIKDVIENEGLQETEKYAVEVTVKKDHSHKKDKSETTTKSKISLFVTEPSFEVVISSDDEDVEEEEFLASDASDIQTKVTESFTKILYEDVLIEEEDELERECSVKDAGELYDEETIQSELLSGVEHTERMKEAVSPSSSIIEQHNIPFSQSKKSSSSSKSSNDEDKGQSNKLKDKKYKRRASASSRSSVGSSKGKCRKVSKSSSKLGSSSRSSSSSSSSSSDEEKLKKSIPKPRKYVLKPSGQVCSSEPSSSSHTNSDTDSCDKGKIASEEKKLHSKALKTPSLSDSGSKDEIETLPMETIPIGSLTESVRSLTEEISIAALADISSQYSFDKDNISKQKISEAAIDTNIAQKESLEISEALKYESESKSSFPQSIDRNILENVDQQEIEENLPPQECLENIPLSKHFGREDILASPVYKVVKAEKAEIVNISSDTTPCSTPLSPRHSITERDSVMTASVDSKECLEHEIIPEEQLHQESTSYVGGNYDLMTTSVCYESDIMSASLYGEDFEMYGMSGKSELIAEGDDIHHLLAAKEDLMSTSVYGSLIEVDDAYEEAKFSHSLEEIGEKIPKSPEYICKEAIDSGRPFSPKSVTNISDIVSKDGVDSLDSFRMQPLLDSSTNIKPVSARSDMSDKSDESGKDSAFDDKDRLSSLESYTLPSFAETSTSMNSVIEKVVSDSFSHVTSTITSTTTIVKTELKDVEIAESEDNITATYAEHPFSKEYKSFTAIVDKSDPFNVVSDVKGRADGISSDLSEDIEGSKGDRIKSTGNQEAVVTTIDATGKIARVSIETVSSSKGEEEYIEGVKVDDAEVVSEKESDKSLSATETHFEITQASSFISESALVKATEASKSTSKTFLRRTTVCCGEDPYEVEDIQEDPSSKSASRRKSFTDDSILHEEIDSHGSFHSDISSRYIVKRAKTEKGEKSSEICDKEAISLQEISSAESDATPRTLVKRTFYSSSSPTVEVKTTVNVLDQSYVSEKTTTTSEVSQTTSTKISTSDSFTKKSQEEFIHPIEDLDTSTIQLEQETSFTGASTVSSISSTDIATESPRTGRVVVRKVTTVITKYYEDGEEVEMEEIPGSEVVEVLGSGDITDDILRKISGSTSASPASVQRVSGKQTFVTKKTNEEYQSDDIVEKEASENNKKVPKDDIGVKGESASVQEEGIATELSILPGKSSRDRFLQSDVAEASGAACFQFSVEEDDDQIGYEFPTEEIETSPKLEKEISAFDASLTTIIPNLAHKASSIETPATVSTSRAEVVSTYTESTTTSLTKPTDAKDTLQEWGKPLGLPSPIPAPLPPPEPTNPNSYTQTTEKKSSKKTKKAPPPVFLDLAYVPHAANPNYTNIDFFRRVRARYYVFSGIDPGREVLNALLQAKMEWEDKEMEVTIIPTYDTDALGYWVAANEEALIANKIDLAPSAIRCTINLQDHETSCNAYRLEF